MTHISQILIVGAGPTGLTLACDLARRGVAFRLIERAEGPATGSRGKGLQPRSLEVLDLLGVIAPVLAEAAPYPLIRRRDAQVPDQPMHPHLAATPATPYPNTLMLPQDRTEAILRERLGALGGRVEFGLGLTDARQDAEGVTATLSNGETVRCAWLVGCDGGKGVTRRLIGAAFEGETREDERVLFADVTLEGLDREVWSMWMSHGLMGLCPLPGTHRFQFSAPLAPDEAPELSLAGLQAIIDARAPGVRLTGMSWISLYRFNARLADRYRRGRILLAGDAAHVHSAAGGQGLNTSVQDAWNLGWKLALALDGAADTLLDSYEAERRPIAADVLGLSNRLHREGIGGNMRRGEEVNQLALNYRDSALSRQLGRSVLQAGDRLPDSPASRSDGRQGRAFDLIRHGGFTDLTLDGQRLLVRPDGYIALAGAVTEDAAGAYLADLTAGRLRHAA
ncbi:2-polyprenyl-6-methoxyphenol hydroxylase-like FAD-dependent oxidoreductase [Caulobacter ginsengisoli]|uniref:2-polyprenyl-6-methoxyphenol hydroxylase-like FAD-dependent oxidoreductase n=1 Tax=Caulobacter ginsengisoli TaxID=400775 RepID=A0ABU0IMQ5_9CAUL|nr:FAD-dependent monooxygenase [Caulobacter ginsengisoli]MDQ0462690.1 2-polyprenyl-6-methoxyphenol hydroxylase-like FAD-dependent oxidoreductase [Caulobacter ginsengisoli]